MTKVKTKKSKKDLFENEEFDEKEEDEKEEEENDDIPEDINPEELEQIKEEDVSALDTTLPTEEEEDDEPVNPTKVSIHVEDDEDSTDEEDDEASENTVVKCTHCQEEIIGIGGICPICGHKLQTGAESEELLHEDLDPLLVDYTDMDEEEPQNITQLPEDPFRGLPYQQEQYSPIIDDI